MNWMQTIRMAFKSIMNNKVRSLLTMLGIIIGVASVIAIVASIQGMNKLQRLQYEAMGTNQIQIYGWGPKNADWAALEEYMDTELADSVKAWSPQSQYYDWQSKGVQYRSKTLSMDGTRIYFGNQDYGVCTNNTITVGRDITEKDCEDSAKVCVIGETVRKAFFGAMSPLEQNIRIGGMSFRVVGVYKGKYGGKLNSNDQMILLPYTLRQRMMGGSESDRQYYVQTMRKEDIQDVIDKLRTFMGTRYDLESGRGYFDAYSNSQWQDESEASSNMFALLGGGIAGISLLVGGIGIMNIMLVSVTERTREIGIRMAIGARKRDIIGQFLIEAAVVSACGGILGIILGCVLSAVLGNLLVEQATSAWLPEVEKFTVLPSLPLILGAFLFSALLGILFGLYPANKASNLQPVDALRTQ